MTTPAPNIGDSQFPRTRDLPKQTPLFWVSQKDRYLRQLLIRDIEALTSRKLVVYFSNRQLDAQIDNRDISLMAELCADIKGQPTDLLLETSGGATDATEGLVSLVQSMVPDLRVVVARSAKSNGTLLAFAAKSIVMGPTSELGPIEPHLSGVPCTILSMPEIAKQNFTMHKAGVYYLNQTKSLAKKLLENGMMKGAKPEKIKKTVDDLSSRDVFFSHGSVINSADAKALGLVVEELKHDDDLWRKLYLLHCMYEYDARRDNLLKIFEGASASSAISAPPPAPAPVGP